MARACASWRFLNPGIKLVLNDLRDVDDKGNPRTNTFFSEGGLREFVEYLDSTREKLIPKPIYVENIKTDLPVQVALSYNTSFSGKSGFVCEQHQYNNEGGTHVAGFRRAITHYVESYADKSGLLEKAKVEISGDDFREGLTAIISVKGAEPQFEGQTKTKLGNSEAMGVVDTSVGEVPQRPSRRKSERSKLIVNKVILSCAGIA